MNTSNKLADSSQIWAALDLGSNSFHLLLARTAGASFFVTERLKEKVQLLGGFAGGQISMAAQLRGLACLARFAQRLAPVAPERILVFGTCALRQANNAEKFLTAAEALLGVPVQVISGSYEAELIYAAVAHHAGDEVALRLVVDIGGGSTELAFGQHDQVTHGLSVNVGCVAYKERFFDQIDDPSEAFLAAKEAAYDEIHTCLQSLPSLPDIGQAQVLGTSGTIASIQTVLVANGWSGEVLTEEAMALLEIAVLEDHWVMDAGVPGLAPDRADIFPAGLAILCACFAALNIRHMEYVDVTLLQGMIGERVLVEDLEQSAAGSHDQQQDLQMTDQENQARPIDAASSQPDHAFDLRDDSVAQLQQRFAVDLEQAARVERAALQLFADSQAWWVDDEECRQLLGWAARLHELGVHISARHYHRHGAYVVKHAEMPGFSAHQQSVLALLIRGHRRSMPGLAFRTFDPALAHKLLRLVALLRLAAILERSHSADHSPSAKLQVDDDRLILDCGEGWLATHPLSWRELQVEQEQQANAGLRLELIGL